MKRIIDYFLAQWKVSAMRKPLLIHGARQVGKTYSVRQLGKSFSSFVEINFETKVSVRELFDRDLDPKRIVAAINRLLDVNIIPGETLLFFDEIQIVPNGITALRYFYEEMPELHVVAAGSLLDFAIARVGMPVGRVASFYMKPMSFAEFLSAISRKKALETILLGEVAQYPIVHNEAFYWLGQYFIVGGMPEMVACWIKTAGIADCVAIPHNLLTAYRRDFHEYGTTHQLKYLNNLFDSVPRQLGGKFKYSKVDGDFRKRELAPCLDLLEMAGVICRVMRSAVQGIPVGADVYFDDFKVIFIDVALCQYILGLLTGDWLINPLEAFVNKGAIVEAFVGQELAAYIHPMRQPALYYWQRESRGSEAEIDYVIQKHEHIIPIEVKSGQGSTLRSMQQFLDTHPKTPYGMRFSTHTHSVYEKIHTYPLYALAQICSDDDDQMRTALMSLV